jgi:hypothetical protein
MIIARDVKIVTSTATTLFARVAYIFSTIEQKKREKNNDKQQFSPVRPV